MALPLRATLEDIRQTCGYLSSKPAGATIKDISAVVGEKLSDSRRLSALQAWGLVEAQESGRYKVTEDGRRSTKGGSEEATALQAAVRRIPAYLAVLERASHRKEDAMTINEVGAHWHAHFKSDASDSEEVLKSQVVSFFQLAEGAGLGTMILGRRGSETRFSFNTEALANFVGLTLHSEVQPANQIGTATEPAGESASEVAPSNGRSQTAIVQKSLGQGIFIAHGKNKKPLEQLKKILEQFRIPYKVAIDEPNLGRPIGGKIREIMEACNCAILIFTADEEFRTPKGDVIWRPSENVVYELGASGYLYDNKLVIMKEDGVTFPSNFRDIGYISFEEDNLEAKAMDVLRELIGFGIVKVST